ncbi:MAG: spondin domain-containing protein, partial [Planctomycetes bacterium]|nr:spondin domain-containing protein [Planctomycetota bacterium]
MNRTLLSLSTLLLASGLLTGCGSDRSNRAAATAAPVASSTAPVQTDQVTFEIVIENLSDQTSLPSPLSPGLWALHSDATQLLVGGAPDTGAGLEALAEDGDPTQLLVSLGLDPEVAASGRLDPTPPGTTQVLQIVASRAARSRLSLATMLVASNDAVYATRGVALFDAAGQPLASQVLTPGLYDAGTETNEPLGRGRHQPARQASPNTGPREGVVTPFSAGTRLLPRAERLVEITVSQSGGELVIAFRNASAEAGFATPFAPLFYALHQDGFELFEEGALAPLGLETLAESGSPRDLVPAVSGDPLVTMAAAVTTTLQRPNAAPGPVLPGETFELRLDVSGAQRLSLASMIVQSNDWFLALSPGGLTLRDSTGALRPSSELQAELRRTIAVWDAGTEEDQAPGAGSNQPLRQTTANSGPLDADDTVRRVADLSSDHEGLGAGGVASVTITPLGGLRFRVEVTNTSDQTAYSALLTPIVWNLRDGQTGLFTSGQPASAGLESLAEDGNPAVLIGSLGANALAGVANTPVGAAAPGPIAAGQTYSFVVTADPSLRFLNFVGMIAPTNDTFHSLGERGVALLDAAGQARTAAELRTEVAQSFVAWDAGTEANEVGAAGPNQPPAQATPNTGPAAGDGNVRPYDDALCFAPDAARMVRITIRPILAANGGWAIFAYTPRGRNHGY